MDNEEAQLKMLLEKKNVKIKNGREFVWDKNSSPIFSHLLNYNFYFVKRENERKINLWYRSSSSSTNKHYQLFSMKIICK